MLRPLHSLLLILLLAAPVTAGCLTAAERPAVASSGPSLQTEEPTEDAWGSATRVVLLDADTDAPVAFAFDVLCAFGGSVEMRRAHGLVHPGTSHIEVMVEPGVSTGIQVGYAFGDAEVTWLPAIANGMETFTIPVTPAEVETEEGHDRWHFHFQNNVKGAEQDCYTGGQVGPHRMLIEAVKGA